MGETIRGKIAVHKDFFRRVLKEFKIDGFFSEWENAAILACLKQNKGPILTEKCLQNTYEIFSAIIKSKKQKN